MLSVPPHMTSHQFFLKFFMCGKEQVILIYSILYTSLQSQYAIVVNGLCSSIDSYVDYGFEHKLYRDKHEFA